MRYTEKILLITFLLWSTFAAAGWVNKQGEAMPDTDFRKSIGDFGAQLIFVGNEDALFERWAIPSETVDVKTVDFVGVNDSINAFVIFSGCTKDDAGNCSVVMRFRVLNPDGTVYAETPAMEVWHDKPAPPGRTLELSVQYLKVIIEPTDQLGTYQVQTQVRDNNSGCVLQLNSPFIAVSEDE